MIADKIKLLRQSLGMSLRELALATGTSKQTIHRYESGEISNIPPQRIMALARALGTTPSELYGWTDEKAADKNFGGEPVRLPVLGSIACGEPVYVEEEHGSYVFSDGNTNADFCLIAQGDSMTGARIFHGDIVFIRSQSSVDNGEVAAVIINDEATLKRVYYYPDEEKLILSPENPAYAPLVYVGEELAAVKILGKAVAFQSRI